MYEQATATAFGDSPAAAGSASEQASDAAESAVDKGRAAVGTQEKPKVCHARPGSWAQEI